VPMTKKEVAKRRVLVFIDGPNLDGQQAEMEAILDFRKFHAFLVGKDSEVVGVRYYTKTTEYEPKVRFLGFLGHIGYEVIYVENGDVDATIVNDIFKLSPSADAIVLVSGDRIYFEPLKNTANSGKGVRVVATAATTAHEYQENDSIEFVDITPLQDLVDHSKTKSRREEAKRRAESGEEVSPGAILIGWLMALGLPVTIETREDVGEIIVRIKTK